MTTRRVATDNVIPRIMTHDISSPLLRGDTWQFRFLLQGQPDSSFWFNDLFQNTRLIKNLLVKDFTGF